MIATIPETRKIDSVCYAVTDDGIELPVIDLTHPAFASVPGPDELAAISAASLRGFQQVLALPETVRRMLAAGSVLARDAEAAFVGGMTTYLQKLGPENLGAGWAGPLDRQLAAGIGPVCMRLRLRETARLLAGGLTPVLAARRGPLHLINIGGGAAADSLNTLILLRRQQPSLLAGRAVRIHVLDLEADGPRFAARALAALTVPGAPLAGVDASLVHLAYDWDDPSGLRRLLGELRDGNGIVGVSSEGGLFEYGNDGAIVSNLEALTEGAPADCAVVGSVMREESAADPTLRLLRKSSPKLAFRLLGESGLAALAARAGWTIAGAGEGSSFYQIVRLARSTLGEFRREA